MPSQEDTAPKSMFPALVCVPLHSFSTSLINALITHGQHNGLLQGSKKEGTLTFCNSMDGPGDYYAKLNEPVRERQVAPDLTHKWNLINKIN